MPCLQLLLKVFISDPQAKCRGFFIPCGGFGGKLPKNRSWGVRVEPSGSSSARPGAQGEAEPQGYGRWEPAARALCCQKSPLGPRLGEGHLLQGILGIDQPGSPSVPPCRPSRLFVDKTRHSSYLVSLLSPGSSCLPGSGHRANIFKKSERGHPRNKQHLSSV